MATPSTTASRGRGNRGESLLQVSLRLLGWICLGALIPLFMPRRGPDVGHPLLGLGSFPPDPLQNILPARSAHCPISTAACFCCLPVMSGDTSQSSSIRRLPL